MTQNPNSWKEQLALLLHNNFVCEDDCPYCEKAKREALLVAERQIDAELQREGGEWI